MSTIYEFPQRADSLEAACEWLAKLDRGLADNEAAVLQAWLAADSAHASALLKVAESWDRMEALSRLGDLFPQQEARRVQWPRQLAAIAATLLVVFTGFWMVLRGDVPISPSTAVHPPAGQTLQFVDRTFETAIGELSTIDLPDGSQMVLNTNSQVHVRFADKERYIGLKRGEINVKVAHDKSRPFDVYAGDKIVRAFGTAFNVRLNPDHQVELIVSEGRVGVGTINDKPIFRSLTKLLGQPEKFTTFVQAGQQVTLGAEDEEVSEINLSEIEMRESWRKGNLVFHGESLKDVVEEVNRYTPVKVVIESELLKERRIAGLYKVGDLEGLLSSLQANFNISHKYISAQEVVLTSE